MTEKNNNQIIGIVLEKKVYDYSEGKAIFLNDEKIFALSII